ncbi:MGMT family protein [Megasphaera sp. ASD88]|uniref:MGMT family protein n=1 Tax=Megasphaera sp. ASD88 TaxID=2027407 RepID=UPI001E62D91C|nr:MGMT family protein [Megasphaera sp. ASD88]
MTKHVLTEELIYEILSVVAEIPAGSVASYGQIARLIGRDRNARLVGKVLSMAQCYGKYPCHRVVNSAGMGPAEGPAGAGRRAVQA